MKKVTSWYSERVGREVTVARWGFYGLPVLIFPTAGGAIAIIDRLVHHADIITIDGDSYRRRVAEAKRKQPRPAAAS